MPESSSNPQPPHRDYSRWLPSWRTLLWVGLAFLAGVLLFAWVWSADRNQDDFFRAGETPPTAGAPDYRPLPVPSTASDREASGLDPGEARAEDGDDQDAQPRLVEVAPPAAPAPTTTSPVPPPSGSDAGVSSQPSPIAGSMPAPRYPRRALRRGESGVVLVRARIGPDGVPTSVEVINGSGSRDLDRAAVNAVERWRFHPARQDGRPTVGTVNIPIEFAPNR
ncbi:energy transducer TonB [Lysobacter sp. A286]